MNAKPFLKWAGGKRQLVPELFARLPAAWVAREERIYFEPFLGGGALFFALASDPKLKPAEALLSDSNQRLVRTYQAVRDDVESVIARLSGYPFEKDFFYETRARSKVSFVADRPCVPIDCENNAEMAAWFIYMNRAGYNGLYRVNKLGEFNVPFGKYKNPTICDADTLRACSAALKGTTILHRPFDQALRLVQHGDFVYCDPPYVPLKATSSFTSYTDAGFGDADQVRLRDYARDASGRGAHVLLSNSSAPRVYELYKEFRCVEVDARRNVNSKGNGRGALKELLIDEAR